METYVSKQAAKHVPAYKEKPAEQLKQTLSEEQVRQGEGHELQAVPF